MQGVWREQHLRAPATTQPMQGVWREQHLRAPATTQGVQGLYEAALKAAASVSSEHQRQRSMCKECGGSCRQSSICVHQRSLCKECGGSSICVHQRQRSRYKECKAGKRKATDHVQAWIHVQALDSKEDPRPPQN